MTTYDVLKPFIFTCASGRSQLLTAGMLLEAKASEVTFYLEAGFLKPQNETMVIIKEKISPKPEVQNGAKAKTKDSPKRSNSRSRKPKKLPQK